MIGPILLLAIFSKIFFWNRICSHVEGHMYRTMIFFLKVLQIFIIYGSAKDRNLRAFFRRIQNAFSCNIFKQIKYCNWPGCLYLPAKDELVSLNRFFSPWALKLSLWFSKISHQRVFFWLWRILKFQFWREFSIAAQQFTVEYKI